jgi:hypothetical protein
MTTYRIASLEGRFQVVETRDDGTVAPHGAFRTEADAEDRPNTYLRMQCGAEVFKLGFSEVSQAAPAEAKTPTTTPASAPESS